ncbi:hypothetical protein ACJMK2_026331 [Sinanodonta woodiana]|uniref:Uncharacterized protein n=1 Tax=Sinanodonta woodiana TaxID=1069815 RepID=A0ABD3XL25_SINWO
MCILKRAVSKYNQTILALETPITWLRPRQKNCKVVVLKPLNVILNQLCSTLDGHVICVTEYFQDLSKLCMGEFSYMVGHPEDILDKNVLKCLLEDEWTKQRDEFRPAYKEIKNLWVLFPVYTICALIAAINKDSIKSIKKGLKLSRCSIINCTPMLKYISLLVKRRPPYSSDTTPTSPYDCIFKSLFEGLIRNKENGSCFSVTIVYTRLVWCGTAIEQAKQLLGDQLYNGEKK